ncbi:PAS domain-containing sensor histidine kinase [Mesorhizobium sp. M2E.F.Ca.ET.209.01.1.1]|uniref:PAS domain-containing sensor histidine kinase n=1 Tax=Mesorhizobium sp. M2E.F.Ca.ET.209.01.1.1 TaxID=2500526 RepID=UPI001FF03306|nr:PAS domain-containing sensor histidine kinase [Mesorhizobium sp. M2E.F.Ca.ET.209.01.1.1]
MKLSDARRGFLLILRGDELAVMATATGGSTAVSFVSGKPEDFGLGENFIRSVIGAGRSRIISHAELSMVCLPLTLADPCDGALYLEVETAPANVSDLEWLTTALSAAAIADKIPGRPSAAESPPTNLVGDPKLALDMIPALTWIGGVDGSLEDANSQWFDYTGLSREAALGWGFIRAFHPDDVEKVTRVWTELLASGEPGSIEARMLRHDGEARYFMLRAEPLVGDDGTILRWYGVNTDIDHLKRVEFELAQSQLVMAVAQRIIETGSFSWDMASDVFTCSAECAKIVGLEAHKINFASLNERVHPDDREMVAEAHRKALQGEDLNIEHRFLLPDGTVKFIHARGRLIVEDHVGPRAYIGTIVDVTETRRSEERIRNSLIEAQRAQASLAEAQRLSHVGSYRINPSTGEVTGSEETYNIYGLDPALPLSREAITERVHPSDRDKVAAAFEKGVRERQPWEIEHRLLMPDGSIQHVRCVTRVETNPDEEPEVFGAIIDQTERVKSDEALQRAQADIVRMNRLTAMGAVTVSIAHEMNQPLMAIVTNAATCMSWLDRPNPDVAEAKQAAERIVEEGKRAGDVLLNIRSMARNSRPTAMTTVDLGEVVAHVLTILRSELRLRQIDVSVSLSPGIASVRGDKVQLQQVLLNLMLNAAEAMAANDQTRRIEVSGENDEKGFVVVRVEDNGEGIDPIASERIFEAFFSTRQDGTGMGLAISRSIIEAHRGTLSARPREGGGAVFELSIPFAREGA